MSLWTRIANARARSAVVAGPSLARRARTAASVKESSCAAAAARTRRTNSPKAWLKSITAVSRAFRGMAIPE
jgi:hypothetical protein